MENNEKINSITGYYISITGSVKQCYKICLLVIKSRHTLSSHFVKSNRHLKLKRKSFKWEVIIKNSQYLTIIVHEKGSRALSNWVLFLTFG